MVTGWQHIDGSGVMVTGWQYINNKWYYMDGSCIMYANTITPDGYYVDGSSARVY